VPDRDYAELSQLINASSESERRSAPVTDQRPSSSGPPAAAAAAASNGLVLGNSALNARYMSGHQQQQVRYDDTPYLRAPKN